MTKTIGIKIQGDVNGWGVGGLKLFDIDDNPIPILSATSSSRADCIGLIGDYSEHGWFFGNGKSVLFAIKVDSSAPEINYVTFDFLNQDYPQITKISLLADKGTGSPTDSTNWSVLRSSTVIKTTTTDGITIGAIIRLGLTRALATEKAKIDFIKAKVKNGEQTTLVDVLSLLMTNTDEGIAATAIINNYGDYSELRYAGLSDTEALLALAVGNIHLDITRYHAEQMISLITTDFGALTSFVAYATAHGVTIPSFTNLAQAIRSTPSIYALLTTWAYP